MVAAQIFSGVGIGLLLGLLLGLSSSPVVGLVVGALPALIASFVGLRMQSKEGADTATDAGSPAQRKLAALRAGCFGLTCVVGLLCGIYLRTHDSLSPAPVPPKQQMEELLALGFSAAEARALVVQRLWGPLPGTAKPADSPAALRSSSLFAGNSDLCERASMQRFQGMDSAIAAYQAMGAPELERVAKAIHQQPGDEKAHVAVWSSVLGALCAGR